MNNNKPDEAWMRRHALHIVAQLPDDAEDASRVLDYARELLETFLAGRDCYRPCRFLRLADPPEVAKITSIEACSLRSASTDRPARSPR